MQIARYIAVALLGVHSLSADAYPPPTHQLAQKSRSENLNKAFNHLDQAQAQTAATPSSKWKAIDGEEYRLDSLITPVIAVIAYNDKAGQVFFAFSLNNDDAKGCKTSRTGRRWATAIFPHGSVHLFRTCVQDREILIPANAKERSKLAKWIRAGIPPVNIAGVPARFDLAGREVMYAALEVVWAGRGK